MQEKITAQINEYIDRYIPKGGILLKAIRYSALSGGKRIRPLLCIGGFMASGGRGKRVFPAACAVEFIHTFSLIHDDLPCMDNDNIRRGIPSAHRVFGEDIALLAGDALLSLAFECISESRYLEDKIKARLIKEMAYCAGYRGLIGGQVQDLAKRTVKVSESALKSIYMKKTALLIMTAVRAGAITARAKEKDLKALTVYGKNLGMAFQIIDDMLDTDTDIGINYARLFGREKARRSARRLISRAVNPLKYLRGKTDILTDTARRVGAGISLHGK